MIYHYTNVKALTNILQDDYIHLWFTNYRYLNDSAEGYDFVRVYKEVVEELVDGNLDSEIISNLRSVEFYNTGIYGSTRRIDRENVTHIIKGEDDVFICCFSSDPDSLDMWRYYSKQDTGCALGFYRPILENASHIRMLSPEETRIGKCIWHDVLYDEEEKKAYVRKILNALCADYKILMKDKDQAHILIRQQLDDARFFFKHSCFASEKEIRAILRIPKETGDKSNRVEYVVINGVIRPYIERQFPRKALISINVSPMASDLAYESVKDYVQANMPAVEVEKSMLPARF